jgi:ABC-2 type transport system ATP-binding protein
MCSRVAIINYGKVIEQGEIDELMRDSQHIRLRIADPEHCATLLRGVSWVRRVEIDGNWLVVYAPVERSSEVSAALAQHNHYPEELIIASTTLEDYFISITREQGDV